jgi:hypothetical protein
MIYQISIIRLIMSYVFIGNMCGILHMYKWWYYFLKILSNLKLVDLSKCEVYLILELRDGGVMTHSTSSLPNHGNCLF